MAKRDHRRRRQKQLRLQRLSDVRRFLADVAPHLREKRKQAEIVLHAFDPRARYADSRALVDQLIQLKAKRIDTAIAITPRLALSRQEHLTCIDCLAKAFSRGFCAKHYQKAKREGRVVTNPKGTGVPFTYGRALKEFDPPYFAGYFDGDGCVAIASEKQRWYPRISFQQTQPDTVMELHATYGGSLTLEQGRGKNRRPKLCFQLVQREAVFALLRDIRPFVVEKRDQVELLFARYRTDMSFEDGKMLKDQLSELKFRTFSETSDPLNMVNA